MNYIKQIRTASYIGLIGSLLAIVVAIVFKYLVKYAFYQSPEVFRTLTLTASVFVILDVVLILNIVRRQVPKLRNISTLDNRLQNYASLIKTMNYCTLVITILVSTIIILLGNYNLLMLAMLLVVTLFFTYPNMYKIKIDLELDDVQMKSLFGDQYQVEETTDIASEVIENTPTKEHEE